MRLLWLVPLLAASCVEYIQLDPGEDAGDGDLDRSDLPEADLDDTPRSLVVEPAEVTLVTHHPGVPATLALRAFVDHGDDQPEEVTEEVSWSFDEDPTPRAATLSSQGILTASNLAGARLRVRAQLEELSATATIALFLEAELHDDDPALPPSPADFFPPSAPVIYDDPSGPVLLYPADETTLPPNYFLIQFQWMAASELDLFRLTFRGELSEVTIYTTRDRWLALEGGWGQVARSHAGGEVTVELIGVERDAPEPTLWAASPQRLLFSEAELRGAVYYWSTSAEGVMRSSLRRPTPERFHADPTIDDTCVGCHTISRDGRQLVSGYGGEHLQAISLPEGGELIEEGRWDMGWATFSPEGDRVLLANEGKLRVIDAVLGDAIGPDDGQIALADGVKATMPDWSPLGDFVALVLGEKVENQTVERGRIARMTHLAGAFGEPEELVAPWGEQDNCFFPAYSPDGAWIAFACARGKSKDQKRSRLYLVSAEGGQPIELTRLNERVGPEDGVIEIGNSMPTWAPTDDPGLLWLAFTSLRDYGHLLRGEERDQLWVSAIDPALAEAGLDPSFAAFWLPLQQLSERNHRAFWVVETDEDCSATTREVCDGVDNDCDGLVDEVCTSCEPEEICGDELDNDCDGVVDEGCQCADLESCDNGVDDDCDGLVDDEDDDCVPI